VLGRGDAPPDTCDETSVVVTCITAHAGLWPVLSGDQVERGSPSAGA